MSSVGRPPELDSQGEVVQKSLVNVTIPSKLANFLKRKRINRSKLFTDVVIKMYKKELCPRCYGEDIHKGLVGIWCADCEPASYRVQGNFHWIHFFNCENCGRKYNPPYYMFTQSKEILKGCFECIPPEERS